MALMFNTVRHFSSGCSGSNESQEACSRGAGVLATARQRANRNQKEGNSHVKERIFICSESDPHLPNGVSHSFMT